MSHINHTEKGQFPCALQFCVREPGEDPYTTNAFHYIKLPKIKRISIKSSHEEIERAYLSVCEMEREHRDKFIPFTTRKEYEEILKIPPSKSSFGYPEHEYYIVYKNQGQIQCDPIDSIPGKGFLKWMNERDAKEFEEQEREANKEQYDLFRDPNKLWANE